MATNPQDVQMQAQLSKLVDLTQEIKTRVATDRLFDILEVVRDQVNRLSHEHESIRADLREIRGMLANTATGAD